MIPIIGDVVEIGEILYPREIIITAQRQIQSFVTGVPLEALPELNQVVTGILSVVPQPRDVVAVLPQPHDVAELGPEPSDILDTIPKPHELIPSPGDILERIDLFEPPEPIELITAVMEVIGLEKDDTEGMIREMYKKVVEEEYE